MKKYAIWYFLLVFVVSCVVKREIYVYPDAKKDNNLVMVKTGGKNPLFDDYALEQGVCAIDIVLGNKHSSDIWVNEKEIRIEKYDVTTNTWVQLPRKNAVYHQEPMVVTSDRNSPDYYGSPYFVYFINCYDYDEDKEKLRIIIVGELNGEKIYNYYYYENGQYYLGQ
jgi:hypothetical protein